MEGTGDRSLTFGQTQARIAVRFEQLLKGLRPAIAIEERASNLPALIFFEARSRLFAETFLHPGGVE
jgi:hypothetical protein